MGVSTVMNRFITKLEKKKKKENKKIERPLVLRKLTVSQNVSHLSTKTGKKRSFKRCETGNL